MTENTDIAFKKYVQEYEKTSGAKITREERRVFRKFFDFGVHYILHRTVSASVQTPALFLPKLVKGN